MDKKRILLGLGLAGAAGAAVFGQYSPTKIEIAASPGTYGSRAETSYAPGRLASLPSREPIGEPKGELFAPRSWAPIRPTVAGQAAKPAVEPPKAPPIPYRVAGQVVEEDGMRVVLTKGDRIFEVRKGQTLEEGFRLESITPHALTFVYVPLGISQELAVAGAGLDLSVARNVAAASPTRPRAQVTAPQPVASSADRAQLRFDGPRRVQAGKAFDVALKLTSPQPVRALPIQSREMVSGAVA